MKNNFEKKLEEILRVDHAGEYGAVRIYEGQLKGLFFREKLFKKNTLIDEEISEIEHMRQQEERHLSFFNEQLLKNKKMNTAFLPIWHVIGYSVGFLSGALGKPFAMSMTKAVEEVIDLHYSKQIDELEKNQNLAENSHNSEFCQELVENLKKFRQEEIDHMNYAKNYNENFFDNKDHHSNEEYINENFEFNHERNFNQSNLLNKFKKKAIKCGSKVFEKSIKLGCHFAIFLSKKI